MPYKDRQKRIEYKRKWNKKYYLEHKQQELMRVKKRKNALNKWFKNYKEKLKCSKCGEKHPACLEFHHRNSEEKFLILSQLINRGYSKERIIREVNKCTVLCANCHRKLHFN